MKERLTPCVYYVCANEDCMKGRKDVTMKMCQTCKKYRARKTGNPDIESVRTKKNKAREKDSKKQMREFC